jgi:hypothetical protein
MSCPHGNFMGACDICDEVAAAYNSGVEHTKQSAWGEANFCPRCGKRLASGFVELSIHTCTPPKEKT